MPEISHPLVQGPASSASSKSSSTKSEEKITSYMWYIHVIVRVNAADRLRDRIAACLEQEKSTTATTATTTTKIPVSPPYSPPFDLDGIKHAGSDSGRGSSNTSGQGSDSASAANRIDDLADYLVLRLFSRVMLETLIDAAPVDEHTDGYARVLAGVPARFREEFCRRLYHLLFSKYILEWPSGIAVPEPSPGSIAAADTSSEATTASTGSVTAVGGGRRSSVQFSKDDDDKEVEFMFNMDGSLTDGNKDGIFNDKNYKHPANQEPASPGYQSTLGPSSPWPDTPSLGYSPELARAAYFGTVSSPLPIQYVGSWGRGRRSSSSSSSRDDGRSRGAYAGAGPACAGTGTGGGGVAAAAAAAAGHRKERLPSPSRNFLRQPIPPHTTTAATTTQARPASLLVVPPSAHSRDQQQHQQRHEVSHTGSCPRCRVGEAWSHGMGGQR